MTKVSDEMKRAPGVHQRPGSSLWHWGIKAPVDLKYLYSGQWAHRCSLETSDLGTANDRAAAFRAHWLTSFAQHRASRPQKATALAPIQLMPQLVKEASLQNIATGGAKGFNRFRQSRPCAVKAHGVLRMLVEHEKEIKHPALQVTTV